MAYDKQGRLELVQDTYTIRETQQGLHRMCDETETSLPQKKQKGSTKRNVVWRKERE